MLERIGGGGGTATTIGGVIGMPGEANEGCWAEAADPVSRTAAKTGDAQRNIDELAKDDAGARPSTKRKKHRLVNRTRFVRRLPPAGGRFVGLAFILRKTPARMVNAGFPSDANALCEWQAPRFSIMPSRRNPLLIAAL
jgi:hypothetical protein